MALLSVNKFASIESSRLAREARLATAAKAAGTTGLAKVMPEMKLPHGTLERGIKARRAQREASASVLSAVGLPESALKSFLG